MVSGSDEVRGLSRNVFNELLNLAALADRKRAEEVYAELLKGPASKYIQTIRCPLSPDGKHNPVLLPELYEADLDKKQGLMISKTRWICRCGYIEHAVSRPYKFNKAGALEYI